MLALLLGALEAWTSRFDMNPDGIQYLDNASAYLHGDLHNAFNTQWSPLYPWLIAACFALVHPAPEQEFPLVHALNFLIYAASLAAFLYLIRCIQRHNARPNTAGSLLLAHSAFLYCSLAFTNLRFVTPDLLVNVFAFLTAALLLRIASRNARSGHFLVLGAVLAVGYLAKAPFLPIAFMTVAITAALARQRAVLVCASFLPVVAAYVGILSLTNLRFTLGDSAKLNVIWHVNGLPNTNWQGGPAANGRPTHPTRQLFTRPDVFEFATPIVSTYPPWYNPGYWNDGAQIAYRSRDFVRSTLEQLRLYRYLFHRQLPLLLALAGLLVFAPRKARHIEHAKHLWPLFLLGIVPFAMYAPVHAEDRYLAPFFVLLWLGLYSAATPETRASRAIAAAAALFVLAESIMAIFPQPSGQSPELHYEIATSLHGLGLQPGDRVAMVTGSLPYYWAYLAGARISLQITFDDSRGERPAEWSAARQILAFQNAAFLVSPALQGITDQPGWLRLGAGTDVFAYPLRVSLAY